MELSLFTPKSSFARCIIAVAAENINKWGNPALKFPLRLHYITQWMSVCAGGTSY